MDYYLEDKARLEGQPKRVIAEYVRSQGFLVPTIYETLDDARKSNKEVYLRSEHEQDYDGVSDVMESFFLSKPYAFLQEAKNFEDIRKGYFEEMNSNVTVYCDISGYSRDDFRQETSFSAWELVEGYNRTIVADSAIPGRYHIMTSDKNRRPYFYYNYSIVEDGKLSQEFIEPLPDQLRFSILKLVENYEQIRNLERFDSNHCPIMEFQTSYGGDYFLQYHRTRDMEESDFVLDRPLADGEIEAHFVRGATPKEGLDLNVTLFYPHQRHYVSNIGEEDGSYDLHASKIFSDYASRKRTIQVIHAKKPTNLFDQLITNHSPRSTMFKPKLSVSHSISDLISARDQQIFMQLAKDGIRADVDLHVVSDGRKAYLKRI